MTTEAYTVIWGGSSFPMMSSGLSKFDAAQLIDDLEARGLTVTYIKEIVS